MYARALVPVLYLALGSGATIGFIKYLVPPAVVTQVVAAEAPHDRPAPKPTDEVVVEIRVRVPPGKTPHVFARDSSGRPQGALVNTQGPLDLAIQGDGFFQVVLPNGEVAYTRVGNFGVAPDGCLITARGHRIAPEIKIPTDTTSVQVGTDGVVGVVSPAHPAVSTVVGQLTLVRFQNPGWLTPIEHGLFKENERTNIPVIGTPGQNAMGIVLQGHRERHSDRNAAALIELIRELGRETDNNADGDGVRVKVRAAGTE